MAEIVSLAAKHLSFDEMLEKFLGRYPWPVGKLEVKRQLGKALHEGTFEEIMLGVEQYRGTEKVRDGFILHPAKFLKEGRWMDRPPEGPVKISPEKLLESKAWQVKRLIRTSTGGDSIITSYDLKEMVAKSLITQEQAEAW